MLKGRRSARLLPATSRKRTSLLRRQATRNLRSFGSRSRPPTTSVSPSLGRRCLVAGSKAASKAGSKTGSKAGSKAASKTSKPRVVKWSVCRICNRSPKDHSGNMMWGFQSSGFGSLVMVNVLAVKPFEAS